MEVEGSRQDDPWGKKAVLSFDGGGVRGFASLLALEKLMEEIKKIEESHPEGRQTSSFYTVGETGSPVSQPEAGFWPCHYFDYMYGTSTGGLNSIMLGRLRMRVDQCIEEYPAIAERIFSNPAGKVKRFFRGYKYKSGPFETKIKELVQSTCPDSQNDAEWSKYRSPPQLCRTVVVSNKIEGTRGLTSEIYYFRTHNHTREVILDGDQRQENSETDRVGGRPGDDSASNCEIWQAARATSAAPSYFKEIEIDGVAHSDGGMGCNNPAGNACVHVWEMEHSYPWTLVSIGTGEKLPSRSKNAVLKVSKTSASATVLRAVTNLGPVKRLKGWALQGADRLTSTDPGAKHALHLMTANKREEGYFRWELGPDLAVLKLDEWKPKSKTRIMSSAGWAKKCVDEYMSHKEGPTDRPDQIHKSAERLVALRRRRMAADPERWRQFIASS